MAQAPLFGLKEAPRGCVVVIEGGEIRAFALPRAGELVIGRADDAGIRLSTRGASRQHARLVVAADTVTLIDLESHNGTRINGARVVEPVRLAAGDSIAISDVLLFVQRAPHRPAPRVAGRVAEVMARLDAVLAAAPPETGALLYVSAGGGARERGAAREVGALLPRASLCAHDEHGAVVAWLPAVTTAEAVASGLASLAQRPAARGGLSWFPREGERSADLLRSAQDRAERATPGQLLGPGTTAERRALGELELVIAGERTAQVHAVLERLAGSDLPVLIQGETGTGKELAASALHFASRRRDGPLLTINCAALPEGVVESELFGHERGAFTGAAAAKPGLLETATGGTLFLDEIGELPLGVQAKLLRVLENKRSMRLGDVRERSLDLRVVAATHRDLSADVKTGRFRQDLLFRLAAALVSLPPLRDRTDELPILAQLFLDAACRREGRAPLHLAPEAVALLERYGWPGNVRELRNLMDYLAATILEDEVLPWHLPAPLRAPATDGHAPAPAARADGAFRPLDEEIRELERSRMAAALQAADGIHARAAQLIGMPMRTYFTKIKRYGLTSGKTE